MVSKYPKIVLAKYQTIIWTEYGFDQQRLIWYVCRLWDMVFS